METNSMRLPIGAAALILAAGLAAPTLAQASADARFAATTLDLSAEGEAHPAPDMATLTLGVTAQGASATEAMAAASAAMTRVIAAVKSAGIDPRQIQTSSLTLNPQYVYAPNEPPKLTGYQAANEATVTVLDLARVGSVADAAVGAGATNVGEISFGLRTRFAAENFARLAAVKALQDKAALYAEASGYHIQRLVNLSEGVAYAAPPPIPVRQMTLQAVAATPVQPGELTVRVTVTGEFELTH